MAWKYYDQTCSRIILCDNSSGLIEVKERSKVYSETGHGSSVILVKWIRQFQDLTLVYSKLLHHVIYTKSSTQSLRTRVILKKSWLVEQEIYCERNKKATFDVLSTFSSNPTAQWIEGIIKICKNPTKIT